MSLFLNERIEEQKKKEEDPLKDIITFTRPWIVEILPINDDDEEAIEVTHFHEAFGTSYKFGNAMWYMDLSMDEIQIKTSDFGSLWNANSCFVSYNLFYDSEMRFLLYSSPKIQMEKVSNVVDKFHTPDEFMEKFEEAFEERKIAKIVIFVEIQLPSKIFDYSYFGEGSFEEYPNDIDQDERFQFLKDGDVVIKCPDGEIRARRKCLKKQSKYMRRHFIISKANESVVKHSIDVIKPIIIFFHTRCFTMPKVYDFDYAKRLLTAKDFFEPKYESVIKIAIEHWLCNKFIKEYHHDFDSILQWVAFVSQHSLFCLEKLLATVIADKFFFKWQQTFPENTRNIQNPLFFSIFGSKRSLIFKKIDDTYMDSLLTNVILN